MRMVWSQPLNPVRLRSWSTISFPFPYLLQIDQCRQRGNFKGRQSAGFLAQNRAFCPYMHRHARIWGRLGYPVGIGASNTDGVLSGWEAAQGQRQTENCDARSSVTALQKSASLDPSGNLPARNSTEFCKSVTDDSEIFARSFQSLGGIWGLERWTRRVLCVRGSLQQSRAPVCGCSSGRRRTQ
jgi:hypothetical protein